MLRLTLLALLASSVCWSQQSDRFIPASTNVWGAQFPRVDSAGSVQIRVKAPDARQVKLNFWSGPKVEMSKESDGFWTVTTAPLAPGLHYYTLLIDGAEVSDTNSQAFFGGNQKATIHAWNASTCPRVTSPGSAAASSASGSGEYSPRYRASCAAAST